MELSLRLGVIGISDGNGHPWSWPAIFNGYDPDAMARCPFPAIPSYLAEHDLRAEAITGAEVTHVWTQEPASSRLIAEAALIEHVVTRPEEMMGSIDALLLARDDADSHLALAAPFLRAGVPVYVDKPLALSRADADRLLALRVRPGQVFSCSALRYAPELRLDGRRRELIGEVRAVRGSTPRTWDRYGPHVIEPALRLLGCESNPPDRIRARRDGECTAVEASWPDGRSAELRAMGDSADPISFRVAGDLGELELEFHDSFTAFRAALEAFVAIASGRRPPMSDAELLTPVAFIEAGMQAMRTS